MKKDKINKNANNIMWVEYWVQQAHPSVQFQISADPYKDGWKCEFDIPLVNKTVSSTSKTEVNAMLNAAKKARKIIEEYVKQHPEAKYENKYWSKDWEIEEDEEGHFLGLGKKSKTRKREGMEFVKKIGVARRAIETAVEKVGRVFDSAEGLYIQVIDKSHFEENPNLQELEEKIWQNYSKQYGLDYTKPKWTTIQITETSVICIMYKGPERAIDKSALN